MSDQHRAEHFNRCSPSDALLMSRSTYRTIVCEQCGAALGRVYTQTQLEVLQGAFCLDVARLRSYELGSASQRLSAASVGYQHQSEQPDEKPTAAREREDLYQRIDELGTAYEALAADMLKVTCVGCDAPLVHARHEHVPSTAHTMMLHVQVQHLLTLHDARLNRLDGLEHDDAGPDQTET